MIGARELSSSVYGAFRLALLRGDGMDSFNRTAAGFWRSFFAAVLVAPGYVAIAMLQADANAFPSVHDAAVGVLAYVIGWVAFPLAAFPAVRLLGREDRYIGYIVAYNWASVPQMLLFAAAALAENVLAPAAAAAQLAGLAAVAAVLAYYWFVAKTALGVDGFAAAGLVILDLVITLIVSTVAGVLALVPAPAVGG